MESSDFQASVVPVSDLAFKKSGANVFVHHGLGGSFPSHCIAKWFIE
jgi:hypothetical protein